MSVRSSALCVRGAFGAALLTVLVFTTSGLRAERPPRASWTVPDGLATVKIVDVLNLFSNVGALIYFVEPNDFGIPEGPITHCSGTLIHERVFLLAGHCTAPTAEGLLPFIKAFVSFSPNALDRSTWRTVSDLAWHPSIPPCPIPEGCTFRGLDPGILDVGLVFLEQPVRDIVPARLAKPGTLETAGAEDKLMVVAGYGHLGALPGGGAPPDSEWDGLRRIKISRLRTVVDNEWASWSLPGIVCYGDSGAPTFFRARVVAVASDGGDCYERDDRARVDTTAAQDWIRQTVADVLGSQR
jgi:hypothetical protein